MSDQESPIYLALSFDHMSESQVPELDMLTKEIGLVLENETGAIKSISLVNRETLPAGAKVAELIFAQQMIMQILPIVTPWALAKIDAIVKSLANRGKNVNAKVQVGSHAIQITPQTPKNELAKFQAHIEAAEKLAPSNRFALVIGNSDYQDERLADLKSSIVDVERFAEVLADPKIGGFTHVETVKNANNHELEQRIERFFMGKEREDLLMLYYSGHGIRSHGGQLFLTAQNTQYDLLRSTGISSNFIKESMDDSYSQRQILILDCCYGGAIVEGAKGDQVIGQAAECISAFSTSGFGRVIITASDSMQYAFDGQSVEGFVENSAFTHHLIEGLRTGEADTDNDGLITVDELYQYGYRKVVPKQNPNISITAQEGQLYIGLNPNPSIKPAELSEMLRRAMHHENRFSRQGAVSELERLLQGADLSMALAAEIGLKEMTRDDSRIVAEAAQDALDRQLKPGSAVLQPMTKHRPEPISHQAPAAPTPAPVAPSTVPAPKSTVVPAPQAAPALSPDMPVKPAISKPKNQNLGGFLNIIVPGMGHVYAAKNWKRMAITFVVTNAVALVLFQMLNLIGGLVFLFMLGGLIYLFIEGKKATQEANENFNKHSSEPVAYQTPAAPSPVPLTKSTGVPATQGETALRPDIPAMPAISKPKNKFLGGVLNIIVPGMGHVYAAKNWKRMAVTFVVTAAVILVFSWMWLPYWFEILCFLGVPIYLFYDGMKVTQEANENFNM